MWQTALWATVMQTVTQVKQQPGVCHRTAHQKKLITLQSSFRMIILAIIFQEVAF